MVVEMVASLRNYSSRQLSLTLLLSEVVLEATCIISSVNISTWLILDSELNIFDIDT